MGVMRRTSSVLCPKIAEWTDLLAAKWTLTAIDAWDYWVMKSIMAASLNPIVRAFFEKLQIIDRTSKDIVSRRGSVVRKTETINRS
jgi:hypothetical protein